MAKITHTTFDDMVRLLRLLATTTQPLSQRELALRLNLSKATITRLLRQARQEYQMVIDPPCPATPYYVIVNWGYLDPASVLEPKTKR
jgi:DNA-binding transcriptional regulator LsrR (DeoR family)